MLQVIVLQNVVVVWKWRHILLENILFISNAWLTQWRRISAESNSNQRIKFDRNSTSELASAFLRHLQLVLSHYPTEMPHRFKCRISAVSNLIHALMHGTRSFPPPSTPQIERRNLTILIPMQPQHSAKQTASLSAFSFSLPLWITFSQILGPSSLSISVRHIEYSASGAHQWAPVYV